MGQGNRRAVLNARDNGEDNVRREMATPSEEGGKSGKEEMGQREKGRKGKR